MKRQLFLWGQVLSFLIFPSVLLGQVSSYTSLDDLIHFESIQILRTNPGHYLLLSDRYLNRAEMYLMGKEYENALEDFYKAYEIASHQTKEDSNISLQFRSLFGMALCYASQDQMSEFYETMERLHQLLNSSYCTYEEDVAGASTLVLMGSNGEEISIYGPDRVSVQECIEFVDGTVEKCRYLIQCVPRREARVLLNITIDGLAGEAKTCCRRGGIWKACLRPLVNKWHTWNQSWKLFAIPPDPAWD